MIFAHHVSVCKDTNKMAYYQISALIFAQKSPNSHSFRQIYLPANTHKKNSDYCHHDTNPRVNMIKIKKIHTILQTILAKL